MMNELALFAGVGGGLLASELLGWRTVCAVEQESYCQAVLCQRQNDGLLPPFPIWDDVCTFDGRPWRGIVDVISGGFPCQDISTAGTGEGLDGERSGLWEEMARIIGEVRPRYAFIENSPMLTVRGLDRVLCDLAKMGFDARWGCVSAAYAGADHKRDRVWIVADNPSNRLEGRDGRDQERPWQRAPRSVARLLEGDVFDDLPAPNAFGSPNGLSFRVDRLKAIGNAQVPQQAVAAWYLLAGENNDK